MNIFRPKSRRISEVNLKGGWVSCERKRWSASPALGPLVIFKRRKLLPAIFLCRLSLEHTFGDSWYRTDRLVCNFYILDFINFTPKSVPDNCLQTHMSNTWCQKGRNIWQSISNKIKKKKKIKSDLPTLFFLRMKPETHIYFCLASAGLW